MNDLDLIVVGTGASGTSVAQACAKRGWRVAIVDERPFGGTCALRGCDPKKVLVGAAELVDWAWRMRGSGFAGTASIDWAELMRFKRSFTEPVPNEREKTLSDFGIATYHGVARFVDSTTVMVGGEPLTARRIVLATGARSAPLNLPGEEHLITSTDFLDLETLPRRIVFIGGGYIAFEFAHVAARAGCVPVILQRGPRVLTGFEATLVDRLVDVSKSLGIDVRVNVEVDAVEKCGDGVAVRATCEGAGFTIESPLAVHAAGRVAELDALDLDAGNVKRTKKGVAVNEFFQSCSNPDVYAVGDCADGGGLPLTPAASGEGELVAHNLLEGNGSSMDFSGLASIVYTIPSLGMTGLTQDAARKQGLRFTVREGDSTQWYSSRRVRGRESRYQILVDEASGSILGAHILGPHTEELVNVFAMAIRAKISASVLESVLFAYPTASSDIATMLGAS